MVPVGITLPRSQCRVSILLSMLNNLFLEKLGIFYFSFSFVSAVTKIDKNRSSTKNIQILEKL